MAGELAQISDTTIVAQYGPMRLTVQAWGRGGPDLALAARAGEFSFSLLPRLARARESFRRGQEALLARFSQEDELVAKMSRAALAVGQADLGPMAAIAGVVADEVALWLKAAGAQRAIVENGGDLAIYLAPGQVARVGVRRSLSEADPSYSLELSGDRADFWGVASSGGQGGRGMSRGIAETALCLATTGALADAAATALGNACQVDSPEIKKVAAETINPDTDIPGLMVTAHVGALTEAEIGTALSRAEDYANSLVAKGVILGGLISLAGQMRLSAGFEEQIAPLVKI